MILFGPVEFGGRHHFRDDRIFEHFRFHQKLDLLFRGGLLLFVMEKYRGAVLPADIRSLSVRRCRVVIFPEDSKQLFIRNLLGITPN